MHHGGAQYGYPTPPASPAAFHQQKRSLGISIPTQQFCQPRFVPVAPEQRLGKYLAGSIQLTGILGTGAYGVVYSAVDVKTGVRYAVKALSKFNLDGTPLDQRQVAFQTREIRLHYLASTHENVVSMLKIIDNQDCIYVILEYCPEGDLFYNITECGHYVGKDALAKSVFLQILDAVEHCHSLGIYHRDLKPENILVSNHGQTVKLADFGLATASEYSEDYGCGSTFYMSPECLDHSSQRPYYYCAPNDVWSLGVVLVNLTCGRNPWKQASMDDSTYRAFIRQPGFLQSILPVGDDLNDILSRIFHPNPEQRITLPELRQRILACRTFTEQPSVAVSVNVSPQQIPAQQPAALYPAKPIIVREGSPSVYVDCSEAIVVDDYDYDTPPLSPASDDSMSDSGASDDGSFTSSCSSITDLDEEETCRRMDDTFSAQVDPIMEQTAARPQQCQDFHTTPTTGQMAPQPVLMPQQQQQQQPLPLPSNCIPQPKSRFPFWDVFSRQCQPQIQQHHPSPFYHQVPLFSPLQGCY